MMDAHRPTASRPAVLIVEDEKLLLDVLQQLFEEANFAVLSAETGERAMVVLQSGHRLDLLVTDIRLPGSLTGWDVAERARELHSALPVVYTTAYSHEVPRPVSGGVLLTKPYRPSALKKVVSDLGLVSRPHTFEAGAKRDMVERVESAAEVGSLDQEAGSISQIFANMQSYGLYDASSGTPRLLLIKDFANEDVARRYARRHYPDQKTWVCLHHAI